MTTTITPVTEEEFFARYGKHDRVELVDGEVVPKYGVDGSMSPASTAHGDVVVNLLFALVAHVRPRGLGRVYTDPAGFVISEKPRRVRCPDVAFVATARAPAMLPPSGSGSYLRLAPDVAAEVLSPTDPPKNVEQKIAHYLEAGVRLVWKVDPVRRTATVYRPGGSVEEVAGDGALDGLDVVPGFSLPLAALFEGVAAG